MDLCLYSALSTVYRKEGIGIFSSLSDGIMCRLEVEWDRSREVETRPEMRLWVNIDQYWNIISPIEIPHLQQTDVQTKIQIRQIVLRNLITCWASD